MLLLCQIHQCIKTSPVKNGWAESRQNLQFGRFSWWETIFVVMCPVYIFSIPPLPSEVCLSTRGFQSEKQGKFHKEKGDPVLNWKGKVFRLVLGWCPALLPFPIPFSGSCGENHPLHQSSHGREQCRDFGLTGPGTVPSAAWLLLLLPLHSWPGSSRCECWSRCWPLCSIFSEQIILSCPQSVFLQESTCPLRSGLNPSINFAKTTNNLRQWQLLDASHTDRGRTDGTPGRELCFPSPLLWEELEFFMSSMCLLIKVSYLLRLHQNMFST